jgi:hypothetical protein
MLGGFMIKYSLQDCIDGKFKEYSTIDDVDKLVLLLDIAKIKIADLGYFHIANTLEQLVIKALIYKKSQD